MSSLTRSEFALSKYSIIFSNGQRIYCPSPKAPLPPRGSEVFVGNLPRDLYEDELVPLFAKVGPLYKVRLMMDFSGQTRGFAFISYNTPEEANRAVKRFDNSRIRNNAIITVHISMDNCRLFFGNIPKTQTADFVKTELDKIVDGVVKVIMYQDVKKPELNRGFVFIEFSSHSLAAIARRKLLAAVETPWGRNRVFVDWAEPEPIIDPIVSKQIKILYFKNLPADCSPIRFKNFLQKHLGYCCMLRVYKKCNYAFVHFNTRENAELAMHKFNTEFLPLDGVELDLEWARPIACSKKVRNYTQPDNFCMSVPPRTRRMIVKSRRTIVSAGSNSNSSSISTTDFTGDESDESASNEDILHEQFGRLNLGGW